MKPDTAAIMLKSDLIIKFDYPLKYASTIGIGGPADLFIEVHSKPQMLAAIAYCKDHNHNYMVIGKGSNVLFSDLGFKGAVILNKIDFCDDLGSGLFYAGAGFSFSLLGTRTAKDGWSGLEFAAGIPASVGGAVYMNAGANGTDTASHIKAIEYIDDKGQEHVLIREDIDFGYRFSSFQKMPQSVIVAATFALHPNTSARAMQLKIIAHRTLSQPLREKSAGCIFQNDSQKSAGALIDECNLKGVSVGDAEVSSMHANFIINKGNATASDVLALILCIQEELKVKKNIHLRTEIQIIPHSVDNLLSESSKPLQNKS